MKLTIASLPELEYEPIGNRVLLSCPKEDVNDHVKLDGILVPTAENRKQNPLVEMHVEAHGPKCDQVRAGQTVIFNVNNAAATTRGDREYRWTEEPFILAIVRQKNPVQALD
jgi:co-chaperonin GroES (HSP10)